MVGNCPYALKSSFRRQKEDELKILVIEGLFVIEKTSPCSKEINRRKKKKLHQAIRLLNTLIVLQQKEKVMERRIKKMTTKDIR